MGDGTASSVSTGRGREDSILVRICSKAVLDGGVMKSIRRVLPHQMPLTTAKISRITTGMGTRTAARWSGMLLGESGNLSGR